MNMIPVNSMVFHRILDFKTGWISILALFFFKPVSSNPDIDFLPVHDIT